MADDGWMDDFRVEKKKPRFTAPSGVVIEEDDDWTKQYRTKKTKPGKVVPRDKSFFERIPLIGGLATKYKDYESDQIDKIEEKNPGFRAAYYNNKKLEDIANDMMGSIATSSVSGPKLLTNIATQALYGGASRGKDIIADKGSDIGLEDAQDVGISSGISALGPLAGRLLSPKSRNLGGLPKPRPPEKPTFESIKGAMRGENNEELLNALMRGRQQALQASNVQNTANSIRSGMGGLLDAPTSAAIRGVAGATIPWMMGSHPALMALGAAGGAVAPHIPMAASRAWNNQLNDALLKSIITSSAVNLNAPQ